MAKTLNEFYKAMEAGEDLGEQGQRRIMGSFLDQEDATTQKINGDSLGATLYKSYDDFTLEEVLGNPTGLSDIAMKAFKARVVPAYRGVERDEMEDRYKGQDDVKQALIAEETAKWGQRLGQVTAGDEFATIDDLTDIEKDTLRTEISTEGTNYGLTLTPADLKTKDQIATAIQVLRGFKKEADQKAKGLSQYEKAIREAGTKQQ